MQTNMHIYGERPYHIGIMMDVLGLRKTV